MYLDLSQDKSQPESQAGRDLLVEDLREQVHFLRSVLNEERDARRRADTIIAQLTQANAALAQRVPELEAPSERSEGAEPRSGTSTPTERRAGTQETTERVSWWRRMFGGS